MSRPWSSTGCDDLMILGQFKYPACQHKDSVGSQFSQKVDQLHTHGIPNEEDLYLTRNRRQRLTVGAQIPLTDSCIHPGDDILGTVTELVGERIRTFDTCRARQRHRTDKLAGYEWSLKYQELRFDTVTVNNKSETRVITTSTYIAAPLVDR